MVHDVAIIGGGLAGCAAAYYLARRGVRSIVLEAGELNGQASGANAGSLHFQLEHRLIAHGDAAAEQFAAVIPLSKHAMSLWRGLESDLDLDLEVVMDGGLMLGQTREEIDLLERKAALEAHWGLETQLLDGEQVHRHVEGLAAHVRGAAFCADEGHANPRLVTLGYARRAAERGARIRTKARVVGLGRRNGRWGVALASGEEIQASALLNAAGAWAGEIGRLANVHIPILPVGLQMNATERASQRLGLLIQHAGKPLSLKQLESGNYLIGGGWPARLAARGGDISAAGKPVALPERIAGNLALACDILPELADLHLIRSWTGTVGVSTDQLPILGRLDALPAYYVVGGGSGFTLGPAFASIVAEQIATGGTDFPVALYSPNRFAHLNMFMGL